MSIWNIHWTHISDLLFQPNKPMTHVPVSRFGIHVGTFSKKQTNSNIKAVRVWISADHPPLVNLLNRYHVALSIINYRPCFVWQVRSSLHKEHSTAFRHFIGLAERQSFALHDPLYKGANAARWCFSRLVVERKRGQLFSPAFNVFSLVHLTMLSVFLISLVVLQIEKRNSSWCRQVTLRMDCLWPLDDDINCQRDIGTVIKSICSFIRFIKGKSMYFFFEVRNRIVFSFFFVS